MGAYPLAMGLAIQGAFAGRLQNCLQEAVPADILALVVLSGQEYKGDTHGDVGPLQHHRRKKGG